MKNYYSISIPKPCHEDWTQMSPREKGKFCSSCSKTVIDFTKMDTYQIQDFIAEHKNKPICGHFKQTQLDSININIPSSVLEQQQSFHKLFLLVLLIVMGSTLLNCTNKHGDKQKIDSIEVVDSINNNVVDVLGSIPKIIENDSSLNQTCSKLTKNKKDPNVEIVTSFGIIETTGDIVIEDPVIEIDSIQVLEPPVIEIDGNIDIIVGIVSPENDKKKRPYPFIAIENPPEFKNTPAKLNIKEKRDYFTKNISSFVLKNFQSSQLPKLGLTGLQKIQTQFKIDTLGFVKDIKVRAIHPTFEKEAKRVLNLLPQFIPGKQNNKPETVVYYLPIAFQVEE